MIELTWKNLTISAVTCKDIGIRLLYNIKNVKKLNPKCAFGVPGTKRDSVKQYPLIP